jgi:hypothetical protein
MRVRELSVKRGYMKDSILLEDLEIYKLAVEIGEEVWNIVVKWEYFPRRQLAVNLWKRPTPFPQI